MKRAVMVCAPNALDLGMARELAASGVEVTICATEGGGEFMRVDPLSAQSLADAAGKLDRPIDVLIVDMDGAATSACTILDDMDYEAIIADYEHDTMGALRAIHAFMPLLERGEGKRLCVVTSYEGSNNRCEAVDNYGRHMARAALNMGLKQIFNRLRPRGYTFRMYIPKTPDAEDSFIVDYFLRDRSNEPESYVHSDENRLAMRDWRNREVEW